MTNLIDTFEREQYWWSKDLACPFWGDNVLTVRVEALDAQTEPTHPQTQILQSVLSTTRDFRPEFEKALFQHYQKEIYGYATYFSPERGEYGKDEITPPIKESSEIWSLISDPDVSIEFVAESEWDGEIRFILSFECHWDDEHGLSIEVAGWKITSFHGR